MKYILEFKDHSQVSGIENSLGILGDLGTGSKFGEQTEYFKRLLEEAASQGIDAYVFTDFDLNSVTAWVLEGGQWVRAQRALPKIVYDRSFRRKGRGTKASNTRALTKCGCVPINSAEFRKIALDKYLMYRVLLEESLGEMKLPSTEKYSKAGLMQFIETNGSCVIKPRFGSGGRGIIKVDKVNDGYRVSYKDYSTVCIKENLIRIIDQTREKMNTLGRAHIMQKCIDLPTYEGRAFDVRVIYQRGSNGEPKRTGMAARVAAPNRITANLHQGGGRETLSRVLGSVFGQDINGPIAESIRRAARNVFDKLNESHGSIGEIGIDFLIDRNGNVHLIEVNSVPGRNLFHVLPSIRETAIRRPIEYAKHMLSQANEKSRNSGF